MLIQLPVGTLGDTLGGFPYAAHFAAAHFAAAHGCRLTCAMSGLIILLLRDAYPDVAFATHEEVEADVKAGRFYATYSLRLFFDDTDRVWQPADFRLVGLHRTSALPEQLQSRAVQHQV